MMKNIFNNLVAMCLLFTAVQAEIIESNEFSDVKKYVNQDSLVLLNVTSTIYEPSNTMSHQLWREYFGIRVATVAPNSQAGIDLANHTKNMIVNNIPKQLVENITPELINEWQSAHIPVLAITRKNFCAPYAENFGEITHKHILSLGIDLEKTLTYLKVKNVNDPAYVFAYGMIFTNKKPEGPAILALLNNMEFHPKNIVMIDNANASLESVRDALEGSCIAFTGIRYGRSDRLKANFNPTLGTIQFFAYVNEGKILSNEEASAILKKNPHVDYQAQLDAYIKAALN